MIINCSVFGKKCSFDEFLEIINIAEKSGFEVEKSAVDLVKDIIVKNLDSAPEGETTNRN